MSTPRGPGRPRKTPIELDRVEDFPGGTESGEPESPLSLSDLVAVQAVLAEAAGFSTARVTVHRANKNESQRWLFTCDPESFNMELLRDKYGGGDFRIYISREGEDGKLAPWRNLRVSIEPPPKSTVSEESGLVTVMREGFQRQADQFQQVLQALSANRQPAAPAIDPVALMGALITGISKMREIAIPAIAPPVQVEPAAEKLFDALVRGMEMGKEMGRSGGDTGPMDLISDLIKSPMMASAIEKMGANVPAQPMLPQPARAAPSRVNGAVSSSAPAPSPQPQNAEDNMLRLYLGQLISRAQADSDPALYADFILDNVPLETVQQWLTRPDLLEHLQSLDNRVGPLLPWFAELAGALRAGVLEMQGEEEEPTLLQPPLDS